MAKIKPISATEPETENKSENETQTEVVEITEAVKVRRGNPPGRLNKNLTPELWDQDRNLCLEILWSKVQGLNWEVGDLADLMVKVYEFGQNQGVRKAENTVKQMTIEEKRAAFAALQAELANENGSGELLN